MPTPLTERERVAVRRAVTMGCPDGAAARVEATARLLGIDLALRPRGRLRKQPEK